MGVSRHTGIGTDEPSQNISKWMNIDVKIVALYWAGLEELEQ